jgi:hypothetical protein
MDPGLVPLRHTRRYAFHTSDVYVLRIHDIYGGTLGTRRLKKGVLCGRRACGGHITYMTRHIHRCVLYGTYTARNNAPMVKLVLQVESPPLN